jgi:hypothetical protein
MAELVFSIMNAAVLPGWLALLAAPLSRRPLILVARLCAAATCGLYVALVVRGLVAGPGLPEGAGFGSLAAVEALMSTRGAILGGWAHFLAFDLFVASWQAEDAPRAGVPHALLVPCLVLTLFAGPAGLLLYLLLAAVFSRGRRAR